MRTLNLIYRDWEKYCHFNFDIFSLMLFYSKEIDENISLSLFKCMVSEYDFKLLRDIPLEGLTPEDENVDITVSELSVVIAFINNVLIPSLNVDSDNILNKYGGTEAFVSLFVNETGFTEDVFIDNDDFQEANSDIYTKENLIYCFNSLKEFLQYVHSNGLPYDVRVDS